MKVAKSSLFFVIALVVVAVAVFVYFKIEEAAALAEKRGKLFEDVDAAVAEGDVSADDLGRLRVRLGEFEEADRAIALALSRLDVLQGRYSRAAERLQPLMLGVDDPVMFRTAALAWLSWPLRGGRDAKERTGFWRQAMTYARSAYEVSQDPADLFQAWQAAARIPDRRAMQSIGAELLERHPQSLQARTVNQASAEDLGAAGTVDAVDALVGEWVEPPIELRLAAAQARVVGATSAAEIEDAQDDLMAAVEGLDELVQEATNFIEVRHWAATAHHLLGLAESAGELRDRHLEVRDQHLGWLSSNAAPDDPRRPLWSQLQSMR